ncbi:uncharacterized protein LOC111259618 [Varroa jacobsoni]|uniref:Uncharacterized protein n=1 Tax=Varroa destructor TaxID=109461 RepID=A0A7M7KDU4_VARDE|nr:uncharacterized protein LOC111250641 [Varroa destructor]XP_022661865.1 uncharacterized protein LOC111250641 [Varroa destructor]XP_022661875.1 uncharacterized protein LOC111250641 [Varroa destructor]XP_022661885.1 uncharacterized protein LOC111250641 [Varroa destructor]XP_022687511.1 uncharacterized protein LOC111259618 [Varroa jacobsoni]XP_022687512.1 uncharacterized protein LOC111259618 [Varroa jacobsoni]
MTATLTVLTALLAYIEISKSKLRCEGAVHISSDWEDKTDNLLQELPSFGTCWMDIDSQDVSGCLSGKFSYEDRLRWAEHLSRCFLGLVRQNVPCAKNSRFCDVQALLRQDPKTKNVFTSFFNETYSFCGFISSLKRTRASLETIKTVAGEVREALVNVSALLIHERVVLGETTSSRRKVFAESLAAQRDALRLSLETKAATLQKFVKYTSTATFDRIVGFVQFITEHSDLFELLLSLTLPFAMCWSITIGELTESARVPLMLLWACSAIVNHLLRDSVATGLKSSMLLLTVLLSLAIYVMRGYRSLHKYHAEIRRLQRISEKTNVLLAQTRRLV